MIAEAIDTAITFGWALGAWLVAVAAGFLLAAVIARAARVLNRHRHHPRTRKDQTP